MKSVDNLIINAFFETEIRAIEELLAEVAMRDETKTVTLVPCTPAEKALAAALAQARQQIAKLEKQARAQGMREAAEIARKYVGHDPDTACSTEIAAAIERAAGGPLKCAIAGCDREVGPRPRTCLEHTPGIIPPDDERAAERAMGGKL